MAGELLDRAASIYDQMNISSRLAAVGIFRSLVKFTEHDYENALAIMLEGKFQHRSAKWIYRPTDPTRFRLFGGCASLMQSGMQKKRSSVMNEGIEFSKEKQVFYRIDYLYRLATFHAMMTGMKNPWKYYESKLLAIWRIC